MVRGSGEPPSAEAARISGRSSSRRGAPRMDAAPAGNLASGPHPRHPTRSGPRRNVNSSLRGAGLPRRSQPPSALRAARLSIRTRRSMYPKTRSWRSSVRIGLPCYECRVCRCRRRARRTGRFVARRPSNMRLKVGRSRLGTSRLSSVPRRDHISSPTCCAPSPAIGRTIGRTSCRWSNSPSTTPRRRLALGTHRSTPTTGSNPVAPSSHRRRRTQPAQVRPLQT
jgi:hypothetical protein